MADDVESIQTLVEEPVKEKGYTTNPKDEAEFVLFAGQMVSEFDPNENVVLLREWKHRYLLEKRVLSDNECLLPPTRVTEFVVFLFGNTVGTPNHLEVLPPKVKGFINAAAQRLFSGGRIVEVTTTERARNAPNDGIPSYASHSKAKNEPFWYHVKSTRTHYRLTEGVSDLEDIDMANDMAANLKIRIDAVANMVEYETCIWEYQASASDEGKDFITWYADKIKDKTIKDVDCNDDGKMLAGTKLKFRHSVPPKDYPPKRTTPVLGTVLPRNLYAGVKDLEEKYVGTLTETGYAALSLLLWEIVYANDKEHLWATKPNTIGEAYLRALNWLYDAIETNFQRYRVERLKFAFVMGRNTLALPTSVTTKVQSLENLNLRRGDQVYCSACSEEFSTYVYAPEDAGGNYGGIRQIKGKTKKMLSFRTVDDDDVETTEYAEIKRQGHDTGMCVQTFHSRMLDLGISPEALETGVYSELLGTYQQAQRRLNRFHERQNKLYERSDSKFNWPDYLTEWLYLKMDVLLKELAGATEGKPKESLSLKSRAGVGAAGAAGLGIAAALTGGASIGISAAAGFAAGFFSPELKTAPLILFKIISFLLRSPMVRLVVEEALDKAREEMCKRMPVKATVQRISDEGRIEELEIDTGRWVSMPEEEQEKILKKDSVIRNKKRALYSDVVAEFLNNLPSEVGKNLSVLLKAATAKMTGVWEPLQEFLKTIPYLGPVAAYLETLTADTVMKQILGMAQTAALLVSKEIQSLAEKHRSIIGVYELITRNLTCETTKFLTTLDGRAYGEDLFFKKYGTRLGVAYEIMMEQAPFIAIDIMSTSDVGPSPFGVWDEDKWNKDVSNYLRFAYVANHRETIRLQQKIYDEKRKFLKTSKFMMVTDSGNNYPLGRTGVMYPRAFTSLIGMAEKTLGKYAPTRDTTQDYVYPILGAVAAGAFAASTSIVSFPVAAVAGAAGGFGAGNYQDQKLGTGDVLRGAEYEMHTVLSVSDNRDTSFRSTLRYFRNKFTSSNPGPPTVNPETLDRVNSVMFDQPEIFIMLSLEDGGRFNLDAVYKGVLKHLPEPIIRNKWANKQPKSSLILTGRTEEGKDIIEEHGTHWKISKAFLTSDNVSTWWAWQLISLKDNDARIIVRQQDDPNYIVKMETEREMKTRAKSQSRQDPDNPSFADRATEGFKRIFPPWT